jgi:nucleotide-binding universal stress UspA family protein
MCAEVIRLRDRFEIRFGHSLPEVAPPGTTAFAARDLRSPGPPLMAVVPDVQIPPRIAVATAIRTMRQPALWTPVDWGCVEHPLLGRRSWVVVGDLPDGGRLAATGEDKFPAWEESELKQRLLQPLLPGLNALVTDGMSHRGIRLDNIWYRDQQRRIVMLGDCVSTPPAIHQPIIYEPVESAMASPDGRGPGRTADDFYALGVVVVHLLCGGRAGIGVGDSEILERKIAQGSLAALTSRLRLSPSLGDLCRGLLADHPGDRWSVRELANWLEGRRLPFKPPSSDPVATRPYTVGETQCMTTRGLSLLLTEGGEQLVETVHDHGLETWLTRALPASKIKDNVAKALSDGDDGDAGSRAARQVARVAIALDSRAPIRYRGVAASPDALGTVLAAATLGPEGAAVMKAVAEIIRARLVQFWATCQAETRLEHDIWSRDFDRLRLLLIDHRPGQGLERIIYELNPRIHCLSPLIETEQATAADELLPALEAAAERGQIVGNPVDRHVAAFAASRTKAYSDNIGTMLGHTDPTERVLGCLSLLARLQGDQESAKPRALSALLRPQLAPLIDRLHSRSARRRVNGAADDAAMSGRLLTLLQVVDNPEERAADQQGFARAAHRCAQAKQEIRRCTRGLETVREDGAETAHSLAGLIAAAAGGLIVVVTLLSAWAG